MCGILGCLNRSGQLEVVYLQEMLCRLELTFVHPKGIVVLQERTDAHLRQNVAHLLGLRNQVTLLSARQQTVGEIEG